MNQPPRRLKESALRLAELFGSADGALILRLLTQMSDSGAGAPTAAAQAGGPGPVRVGIWEAVDDEGGERSFVRRETGEPWTKWANVQCIPPKRRKKRVVLIGESVARGYLYDPHFNPAGALQEILSAVCGQAEVEVVDLARIDLALDRLPGLVQASLALEPDVLLVFAGNNWHPLLTPGIVEYPELAEALRGEGGDWAAVKRRIEADLAASAVRLLQTLGEVAESRRIPVVFMLPEFNLTDWRTDCDSPPMLGGEERAEWLDTRREAEALLRDREGARAEALGRRLLELDGGTHTAGPFVVAEVQRRGGDLAAARQFFEQARDASVCWPFMFSPRCFSVIQEAVRANASDCGVRLVDLPQRFAEYLGGELPGRRLFLDYCHLSHEGIRVSMALAAEALLPLLDCPARPWEELLRGAPKGGGKLAGEAHFLAAVHNANWGQGAEIVRHHCRSAVEAYPQITRMMRLFLDFQSRRAPSGLCRSFDQLCELKNIAAINLLYNHSVGQKFLNTTLIAEVARALEEFDAPARASVDDLIVREHAVTARGVNLLEMMYSTDSFARPVVDTRPAFYRATSVCSRFRLVYGDTRPVSFALTLRAARPAEGRKVSVSVNGARLVELPVKDVWTAFDFEAPAALLRRGLNSVEINWPTPGWSGEEWRGRVAEQLEAGKMTEVIPAFGAVHSFRASLSAGPEASPPAPASA